MTEALLDEERLADTLQALLDTLDLPAELPAVELSARLEEVVAAAVGVLRVDSVGLMLLDDVGVLRTVGTADELGALLEDSQAELELGPGVDTVRSNAVVTVSDLAEEEAYAPLWARVHASGPRALLSSPVRVHGAAVGNFNAILRQPHQWSAEEIRATQAYANVVGLLLRLTAHAVHAAAAA